MSQYDGDITPKIIDASVNSMRGIFTPQRHKGKQSQTVLPLSGNQLSSRENSSRMSTNVRLKPEISTRRKTVLNPEPSFKQPVSSKLISKSGKIFSIQEHKSEISNDDIKSNLHKSIKESVSDMSLANSRMGLDAVDISSNTPETVTDQLGDNSQSNSKAKGGCNKIVINELQIGDYFGEISCLTNLSVTATIHTVTYTV